MELGGTLGEPHGTPILGMSGMETSNIDTINALQIIADLKSEGLFDILRKDCWADVDTKPAYQNLLQRVEASITEYLGSVDWKPDLNKNKIREHVRKQVFEMHKFDTGIDHVINQVITPKTYMTFSPRVEHVVNNIYGIKVPVNVKENKYPINGEMNSCNDLVEKRFERSAASFKDLLPNDLDPISPSERFDDSDEFGESDTMKKDKAECASDSPVKGTANKNIAKGTDDVSPEFEPLNESIDMPAGNIISDLEEVSADSSTSMGKNAITESKSVNGEETFNVTSTEDDAKLSSSPMPSSSLKMTSQDIGEVSSEAVAKINVEASEIPKHNKSSSKSHVDNGVVRKKEDRKKYDERKREDEKKKNDDKKKESEKRKVEGKKKEEKADKHDRSRDKDHKKDSRDRKTSESSKKESKDRSHKSTSSSSHDHKKHSSKERRDKDGKSDKDSRGHSSTSSKDKDHSHHHKSSSSRHKDDKSKSEKDTKSDHPKRDKSKEKSSSDHHKSDHSKKSDSKRSDKDGHRDKQKHSESKERSGSHGSSSSSSHRHERRDSKSSKSEDKNKEHSSSSARDSENFKSPSKHEHKHSNKPKDAESPHSKDKQQKDDKTTNKTNDKNKVTPHDSTKKLKETNTKINVPNNATDKNVCATDSRDSTIKPKETNAKPNVSNKVIDKKNDSVTDFKVMATKPKIAANMYEVGKIIRLRKDFDRMEKKRQKQGEEVKLEEEKKKKEEEKKKEKKIEEEEEEEEEKNIKNAQKSDVEMTELHPQIQDLETDIAMRPPDFSDDEDVTTMEDIEDYSYIPADIMKQMADRLLNDDNMSCISVSSVKTSDLDDFCEEDFTITLNAQEWLNLKQEYPSWIPKEYKDYEIPDSPKSSQPNQCELPPLSDLQEKYATVQTEQIIKKSDNMGSSDRAIAKPKQSKKITDKVTPVQPRKKPVARKRRACSEDAKQHLPPPVPEKRFLLPPSPAESAASTENKAERRRELFDIEEELEKGKDKTAFDGTFEATQNGLIDCLVPTPPTDIHMTDSTGEDAAIVSPGFANGETKPLPKKTQAARGRAKRGQGIRRTNIKQQQRYESSDLYKPRPTFTPSRRLREIAANAKAEAALQGASQPLHITK